jgi:hypothetical protein
MIPPPKKIINVCMQKFSKKLATKIPQDMENSPNRHTSHLSQHTARIDILLYIWQYPPHIL